MFVTTKYLDLKRSSMLCRSRLCSLLRAVWAVC